MANPPRLPKWTASYLLLQAVAVIAWWLALSDPKLRSVFFRPGQDLRPFFVADLVIYCVFGIWAAVAVLRTDRLAPLLCAIVFGGTLYATAWTLADSVSLIASALMIPSCLITGYISWRGYA